MGASRSRRCCPQQQMAQRQCGRNVNVYQMPPGQCGSMPPPPCGMGPMMPLPPMMAPQCGGYGGMGGFDGGMGIPPMGFNGLGPAGSGFGGGF
jgi:hypothetical protein